MRKGRCPLNPAPPGALAGAKARQSCSNGGETVRKGRCPLNPALPGAFPSQRLSLPRALAPASIKTSLAQPHQISKNRRAGQTHLSSRDNRRRKASTGHDLTGKRRRRPKVGSRGLATPFQPCRRKEGAEGIVARQARSATCPKAAASGKRKLWGTTDDLAPAARTCRRAPAKRS